MLSSSIVVLDQDLPEPASFRGQFVIPLDVGSDVWRTYYGLSYWLAPISGGRP